MTNRREKYRRGRGREEEGREREEGGMDVEREEWKNRIRERKGDCYEASRDERKGGLRQGALPPPSHPFSLNQKGCFAGE